MGGCFLMSLVVLCSILPLYLGPLGELRPIFYDSFYYFRGPVGWDPWWVLWGTSDPGGVSGSWAFSHPLLKYI